MPLAAAPLLRRAAYLPAAGGSGGNGSARAPCRSGTRMARGRPEASGAEWPQLRQHRADNITRAPRNDDASMTKSLCLSLSAFGFDSVHFDARSAAAGRRRSGGDDAKMTATLILAAEPRRGTGSLRFHCGFRDDSLFRRKHYATPRISSAGGLAALPVKPSLPPLAVSHQPAGPRCFLRTSSRQTSRAVVGGQAVRRATVIRILPLSSPGPVLLFSSFQSFTFASSSIHPAASSRAEAASITAVKVKRLPTWLPVSAFKITLKVQCGRFRWKGTIGRI